ncbi:MAG TPA: urease accessory protein UreD, partial [Roseiflexaceae bacterium]|nr:urease accessory protein UreD [Roseiflexaceae bacterium]
IPQPPAPPQKGTLDLLLEQAGDRTRPTRATAAPPLQVSRARYDNPAHPGALALTVIHLGGVLAGDRYDMRVALGPGAHASITTAAATQVYRMPEGEAEQTLRISLAPGSRLDWLPEPLILFGGSRFRQRTLVELAPGARLALLEVLTPGRLARGECFAFERYEGRVEISAPGGRLLAAERALLEPARRPPSTPGMFGDTPVLGSLYLLGDFDAEAAAARLHAREQPALGATPLPGGCGLLVRLLGPSPSAVQRLLKEVLSAEF